MISSMNQFGVAFFVFSIFIFNRAIYVFKIFKLQTNSPAGSIYLHQFFFSTHLHKVRIIWRTSSTLWWRVKLRKKNVSTVTENATKRVKASRHPYPA